MSVRDAWTALAVTGCCPRLMKAEHAHEKVNPSHGHDCGTQRADSIYHNHAHICRDEYTALENQWQRWALEWMKWLEP